MALHRWKDVRDQRLTENEIREEAAGVEEALKECEPGTYSAYIERLITWLTASGVKVHPFHTLPHWGGMYRSETKEIFIHCPGAREALLTLAHEAGHWLGHEVFGVKLHSYQRERQAFVYGWRALCLVGASRLISRQEWITESTRDTREALV